MLFESRSALQWGTEEQDDMENSRSSGLIPPLRLAWDRPPRKPSYPAGKERGEGCERVCGIFVSIASLLTPHGVAIGTGLIQILGF